MERCGTAGFRNPDALLSIAGKSGELRPGGRKIGAGGSGLLDLPLGVKIPVQPGTKPVFCRTKLGEKLHQPSPHFDLGDPYCRHLRTEYNSLHDPHLQDYHNRKDNLQNLKKRGLVTKDGKVVCTLKEFNEYRQYLTRLKLEREQTKRREEENLGQISSLKKYAHTLTMNVDKSSLCSATTVDSSATTWTWKASPLQPHKPAGPPPRSIHQSGQRRRLKMSLVQQDLPGDSKSRGRTMKLPVKLPKLETSSKGAKLPGNIHTETASGRKPQFPGGHEVPDPSAGALRRASLRIRQRLPGSTDRAESSEMSPSNPDHDIGLLARKLVASVLKNVGKPLKSSRREASDKASSQASLHKATREAAGSVLQSFVASHSEQEFGAEYSETMELPTNHLPPQPSQVPLSWQSWKEGRGSSEEQSPAASKREKLPTIQPIRSAAEVSRLSRSTLKLSTENAISKVKEEEQEELLLRRAKTIVTDAVLRAKKNVENELQAKALSAALDANTMASGTVGSVSAQSSKAQAARGLQLSSRRPVVKEPCPRGGKESCPSKDLQSSPDLMPPIRGGSE
ncbi:uncharacterized protein LOC112530124 [Gallus gallus]|uniref:uncharacterized protein LOC112530124 n=1 Tax=Gallus gallus TaxID=9031 RepID=UPI001AE927DA|nr:uncharacterized protein LOC112530124 [Gallus gallus]